MLLGPSFRFLSSGAMSARRGYISRKLLPQRDDHLGQVSVLVSVNRTYTFRSDSVLGGFNRSRDFVVDVSQELNIGPHTHSVCNFVI